MTFPDFLLAVLVISGPMLGWHFRGMCDRRRAKRNRRSATLRYVDYGEVR